MAILFNDLQRTIGQLAFADPRVLATAGLAKLADNYESYPARVAGQNVLILVKRGLTPRKAKALTERETAANVLVLEQADGRWRRVWPVAEETMAKAG